MNKLPIRNKLIIVLLPIINILFLMSLNSNPKFYIEYNGAGDFMQYLNLVAILLILTTIFTHFVEEIVKTRATLPVYVAVKTLSIAFKLIFLFFTAGLSKLIYNLLSLIVTKFDSIQLIKNVKLIRIWTKEDLVTELNMLLQQTFIQFTEEEKLHLVEISSSYITLKDNMSELMFKKLAALGLSTDQPTSTYLKFKFALSSVKDFLFSSPTTLILTSVVIISVAVFVTVNVFNFINFFESLKTAAAEQLKFNAKSTEAIKQVNKVTESLTKGLTVTSDSVTDVENHLKRIVSESQVIVKAVNENFANQGFQIAQNSTDIVQLKKAVTTLAEISATSITDAVNELSQKTFNDLKHIVTTNNKVIETLVTLIDSPSLKLSNEVVNEILIKTIIENELTTQSSVPLFVGEKLRLEKTPEILLQQKEQLLNLKTEIVEPIFVGEGKKLTELVPKNPISLAEKREAFANALEVKK